MVSDYRLTKYCNGFENIEEGKKELLEIIKKDAPGAKDMHRLIRDNAKPYKNKFIEVYNGKCGYCGFSIHFAPRKYFEIDHFLYEKSPRFEGSKAKAGYIENLVLSCYECNRNKRDFDISDDDASDLHPDEEGIKKTFIRDENYYIKISNEKKDNDRIKEFYSQLKLDSEIRRLDYLLMNLKGFRENNKHNTSLYVEITEIIEILQLKRNLM